MRNEIQFGSNVKIGFSTICEGKNSFSGNNGIFSSFVGFGTYIGLNSHVMKTKIGRYCSIGQNLKCVFGKHPTENFVSTHPSFFSVVHAIGFTYVKENKFEEHANPLDDGIYSIVIGNDVWIGDNVSIIEGVRIGDGAIIAANALITKDIKPYSIVGGVPAKIIRKRFSENQIQFLLGFKWWNYPEQWIIENAEYFEEIENFQSQFETTK